jgi:lipopolysaccharide export system protein LptC
VKWLYWSLGLGSVAVAVGVWLPLSGVAGQDRSSEARQHPDLYIEQPRWELFDASGKPAQRLQAQRLEQRAGEPDARLVAPRMQLTDARKRHWRVRSERGRLSADGDSLHLQRRVSLHPAAASDGPHLNTERLSIATRENRLETDAPVVLKSGAWHYRAGGLRIDLDGRRIEMLNRVEGLHD